MRKAQARMLASRPYAARIRNVIEHLAQGRSEYRHPYLIARPKQERVGIIVVATDRGLCGGLNVNLFRNLLTQLQTWQDQGKEIFLCAIGVKAEVFLRRLGFTILASASRLGDTPTFSDVIGPVGVMLDAFDKGQIDSLHITYNSFINTMSQKPVVEQLLPISPEHFASEGQTPDHWDYIYEPDAKELLDLLLSRFIESQVYHGVVENFASEQAARMIAMRSASDNAGDFINGLQLAYNKARQAAITRELAEIVGGAAAV
jgi:F-type H+-transporting ATPase subunit gamma